MIEAYYKLKTKNASDVSDLAFKLMSWNGYVKRERATPQEVTDSSILINNETWEKGL